MKDFRDNISTHYVNDRDNLYRFVRDSRLPWGTFDPPLQMTQSGALYAVSAVIAVVFLLAWSIAA